MLPEDRVATSGVRLTFEDAELEQLRAPEPYDVLLGAVARVRLECGVVVYREELFPIAELALALEDWLRDGLPASTDFTFDSVEHDEPGLIWCRSEEDGWRLGSIHADATDPFVHSSEEVAEAFHGFVEAVRSWVRSTTGRDLDALRTTLRPPTATASGEAEHDGGCSPSVAAPSTITVRQFVTLLRHEPGTGASAEIVGTLSRLAPETVLVLGEVVKNDLQVIYERRAARTSSATGVDHLVNSLQHEHARTVLTGYVRLDEALVYLFLTNPPARLLGCVVGSDRREPSS